LEKEGRLLCSEARLPPPVVTLSIIVRPRLDGAPRREEAQGSSQPPLRGRWRRGGPTPHLGCAGQGSLHRATRRGAELAVASSLPLVWSWPRRSPPTRALVTLVMDMAGVPARSITEEMGVPRHCVARPCLTHRPSHGPAELYCAARPCLAQRLQPWLREAPLGTN
jgi:hypothetical protein